MVRFKGFNQKFQHIHFKGKRFLYSIERQLGDSPWHKDAVNGFLIKHFKQLTSGNIFEKSRIFVPLCGKTFDMKW